jgi:hypothetical protein
MDDKLVRQRSELATLDGVSLTPSETSLLKQIDATAQNAKTELNSALSEEWMRKFKKHPPEAIEWAFRAWRDSSPFMPAISDIAELLGTWHQQKREAAEAEQRRQDRKGGEVVTWPQVLERFAEITGKTSEAAFEEVAKPIPRAPLDVETWDAQQLRQTKEARKAELEAWKDRRSK